MRTRTALTAAAALLAAVALTSCGPGPEAKPKTKPTLSPQDKFLGDIVDHPIHSWDDNGPTQKELVAYPKKWCAGLKEEHSVRYLFDEGDLYPIGWDWGTEQSDAYKVLLLAVDAYCPTYRPQVAKELRESGDY